MISELSQKVGIEEDELRRSLLFIIQIPLSFLFYKVSIPKDPKLQKQHIIIRKLIGSGMQFIFWLFLYSKKEVLVCVCSLLLGYVMSQYSTTAKNNLHLNLLTFLWIFFAHIHKYMIYDKDVLDISFVLMLLVPRMCYFNNYMHQIYKNNLQNEKDKMQRPSFLDYVAYTTNFLGNTFNPTFSYVEYDHFIRQTYQEQGLNIAILLKKIIQLIVCFALFMLLTSRIDFDLPYKYEFNQKNMIRQQLLIFIISFGYRVKYYIGFLMGDITSILGNMRSAKTNYERNVVSQNISKLELQFSTKIRIENWNISINQWLRDSFYDLSQEAYKLKRTKASFVTFMISAFWHGVYPAYYFSFFMMSMVTQIEKFIYKNPNLFFMPQIVQVISMDISHVIFKSFNNQRLKILMSNIKIQLFLFVGIYFFTRYFPRKKAMKVD